MWWHECHVGNVGHIGYVGACSHHFTSFLKVVSTLPYHRLWLAATVHMQWGLTVVWHRLGRAPMAGWVTEDPRMSQTSGTSAHCKVLWHACQVCTAMPSSHGHTWQCSHFVLSQQSWFWVDAFIHCKSLCSNSIWKAMYNCFMSPPKTHLWSFLCN